MRISQVPTGTIIKCCGSKAEVLNTGAMGTRVKVLTVPERSGFALGNQIWSNDSTVEYVSGFDNDSKEPLSTQIGRKLPLTLF